MIDVTIRALERIGERELDGLCELLIDCVEGGASVSFMLPMTRAKAEAFWLSAGAAVARGESILLVAEAGAAIAGSASLIVSQPENQPHRANVAKMLVRRSARRQGVGAALLASVEDAARGAGKSLLVLDTVSGSAGERLYARHGWQRCGEIPNYALWPDGRPCATTIMFKQLSPPAE